MISEGLITLEVIENSKSNKDGGRIISIGLPAYCVLQTLLHSLKANSAGILLSKCLSDSNSSLFHRYCWQHVDNCHQLPISSDVGNDTEINTSNKPKDAVFDWFLNPLLIIKEQIKANKLSDSEEDYLGKLVLLSGDPERLKNSNIGPPPDSERKRAELDALARR